MREIENSDKFELQLIATGMHVSKKFGNTVDEIESDGFAVAKKIDLDLSSDTPIGISFSTSLGINKFAAAFEELMPDLVLILGDRFELLSIAVAALFARLPIAHIHGGELTEGLIDEAIRHAVTKFSHLHFVACEEYRKRVIQLGEKPSHVFNVGGLGVDAIQKLKLLTKSELETSLNLKFLKRNLLITFHPVTLESQTASVQIAELLTAVQDLENTLLIFTMPNADPGSDVIFEKIENFALNNKNVVVFKSLGQLRYLSCLRVVDAVVGNSSSGLLEVPTFNIPTINIGNRQKGRIQASSVINCEPESNKIKSAICEVYCEKSRPNAIRVINPYGNGGAVENIMAILSVSSFENLLQKKFHDIE